MRILLVEDNPGDVFLVERALEEHGIHHQLHVLDDGAKALHYIEHMGQDEQFPVPDLVLLDLNIPKVEGPQVLAEFRKRDCCTATPVIVVTSAAALREQVRLAPLGISRYFQKPTRLESYLQLGAIIREVMTRDS